MDPLVVFGVCVESLDGISLYNKEKQHNGRATRWCGEAGAVSWCIGARVVRWCIDANVVWMELPVWRPNGNFPHSLTI